MKVRSHHCSVSTRSIVNRHLERHPMCSSCSDTSVVPDDCTPSPSRRRRAAMHILVRRSGIDGAAWMPRIAPFFTPLRQRIRRDTQIPSHLLGHGRRRHDDVDRGGPCRRGWPRSSFPGPRLPQRPLRTERHSVGQRLRRLPQARQCARRRDRQGIAATFEECETGYATDRGVECYERLKGKGPTGASSFSPLSTGITFALTEKTRADKIPIITMGYGRSESTDGSVFPWNFPLTGTCGDAPTCWYSMWPPRPAARRRSGARRSR